MNILNNLKLSTKLAGGYVIVLVLMAIVSIVVFNSINRLVDSSKWVNHTYEVIRTAESVGAAMVDMETGQRGFMIAGKDAYLDPFNKGQSTFDELIAKGQELTSDNRTQDDRWQAVASMKQQWLADAATPATALRPHVTMGAAAVAPSKESSARIVPQ